jgi:hypothetical protein
VVSAVRSTAVIKENERIGGSTQVEIRNSFGLSRVGCVVRLGNAGGEAKSLNNEEILRYLMKRKMFSTFSRFGNRDMRVGWTTDIDK